MQTTRKWLSRILQLAGLLLLLALFAWGVDWASRQAELAQTATLLPAASEPLSYPPPEQATSLPTPSATVPGYPPPPVYPTPLPTFTPTPTTTPWPISALPPLPTYAPPGPFSGMQIMYYISGNVGANVIRVDGSGDFRWLREDWGENKYYLGSSDYLRVSPDGRLIIASVFVSMAKENASIWVMNPDGSQPRRLVAYNPEESGYPVNAQWSPDGSEIAYRKLFEGYMSIIAANEIWLMDPDGSNQHMIYRDQNPQGGHTHGGPFKWFRNGYIYVINHEDRMVALNPQDGSQYPIADQVDYTLPFQGFSPNGTPLSSLIDFGTVPRYAMGKVSERSADGSLWLFLKAGSLWLYDYQTGLEESLADIDQEYTFIVGLSPDNRYAAYQTVGAGLYVIDLQDPDRTSRLVVAEPDLDINGQILHFRLWIPVP